MFGHSKNIKTLCSNVRTQELYLTIVECLSDTRWEVFFLYRKGYLSENFGYSRSRLSMYFFWSQGADVLLSFELFCAGNCFEIVDI